MVLRTMLLSALAAYSIVRSTKNLYELQ